tara:strand:- start:1383 stop:1961 length:579 start_codon:yes stop_codon:yes gene_type:complete
LLNTLEFLAVISGVTGVWLAKKEKVWLYPVGIISVLIWIYLCWVSKLYGQSLINVFFFAMNIYGWFNWLGKDKNNQPNVVIRQNSRRENYLVLIVLVVLSILIYFALVPFQEADSSLFYVLLESIITSLNFVAMWLMAWKRLENWILWIIGDIMCIPLFIHKDYPIGVIQFVVFIVIAYLGYKEWKSKVKVQ